MSAYVCSPEHFKTLAIFAAGRNSYSHHRVDPRYLKYHHADFTFPWVEKMHGDQESLATYYANVLYRENIRSVEARYPGSDELPGPVDMPDEINVNGRDMVRIHPRPLDVLKMIHCLEYQSCETDDWRDTAAFKLLQLLKDTAIRELPGYDEAVRDAA